MLSIGLVTWCTSLWRPAWTRNLAGAVHRRWRIVAATVAGLLLLAAADPLIVRSPEGIAVVAGRYFTSTGLAAQLAVLALVVLPILADALVAPHGTRTLVARAARS